MEVNASLRDVRHISQDPFFYDPAHMRTATGEAPKVVNTTTSTQSTDGGTPVVVAAASNSSVFSLFSVGQYYAFLGHSIQEATSAIGQKFLPPAPQGGESATPPTPSASSSYFSSAPVPTVTFTHSGTELTEQQVLDVTHQRASLDPPSVIEAWNTLFVCVRRATHTSTMGFSDPSVVQCSEDFLKRTRAWYYWAPAPNKIPKVADSTITSRQKELQEQLQKTGHGGSAGGAASITASLKQRQMEREHQDANREAIRFVLAERKDTVSNLYTLPWSPSPAYVEVLRRQGRLPEQLDEAVSKVLGN